MQDFPHGFDQFRARRIFSGGSGGPGAQGFGGDLRILVHGEAMIFMFGLQTSIVRWHRSRFSMGMFKSRVRHRASAQGLLGQASAVGDDSDTSNQFRSRLIASATRYGRRQAVSVALPT